ncbi:asparagine synthase-related protein [Nocardia blacklockiae]|uniref:asparagine synthase-related protein n=1 Tax=Nocardia blacklockiae TaxID=480036 RepID=UPI001894F952|nr:asparagine synthase C-terminal domain-containing protein [Nocardia blacklockiae]MBF6174618.1 asparagine synthase [Nocardia blacklockiae]
MDIPSTAPKWFVAVADNDESEFIARRVRAHYGAVREIAHPSGRPWILGAWADSEIVVTRTADSAGAALGEHTLSPHRLAGLFGNGAQSAEPVPGSFHLIDSRSGRVRVRGTASGLRRVFHTMVDGVRIASDRADVLAVLAHSAVDEHRLAMLLLYVVPWPLSFRSVWSGIDVVSPGYEVEFDERGRVEQRRWWHPPAAELSLAEGAELFRARLRAAVGLRVAGKHTVAADLGGVDSTALCCLAAERDARVVAITAAGADALDDDVHWARQTVAALGTVTHDVVAADALPLTYAGIAATADRFDEPCLVQVNKARLEAVCHRSVEQGAQVRLVGFGGDEILRVGWGWLHSVARRHPVAALRTARRWAAKHRYPLWRMSLRMAADRPYSDHLTEIAHGITTTPSWAPEPAVDWGLGLVAPPWLTADATAAVRAAVLDSARDASPVSPDRGLHQTLEQLYGVARGARLCGQFADRIGVPIAAPYLDDAVVAAALSVNPVDRVDTERYKPLLAEAMAGIVPEATRHRGTKANTSAGVARGLRRHRGEIGALLANSRLADLAIIDARTVRECCREPLLLEKHRAALDLTIAVEAWLQAEDRWTRSHRTDREGVTS